MAKDKDKLSQRDIQSIWGKIQAGDIKREKNISKRRDHNAKKKRSGK
jgi:hypothetical protein